MKNKLAIFIIILFPLFSCNGQDNPFMYIKEKKITLRYSKRNDIERFLGSPEVIQFFERGNEDFFWKDFTVCYYGERKLSFHYDQNDAIIRITVNVGYIGEVLFLEKNIKTLIKEDILNLIKPLEKKDVYISDSFIMYDRKPVTDGQINYSFWFGERGRIEWIDIYYPWPW